MADSWFLFTNDRANTIPTTVHTVKGFEVAIVVMSESNPIVARRETLAQKGC